jgi:hypothetical protein
MQEECPIFKAMKIHIKHWFSRTNPRVSRVVTESVSTSVSSSVTIESPLLAPSYAAGPSPTPVSTNKTPRLEIKETAAGGSMTPTKVAITVVNPSDSASKIKIEAIEPQSTKSSGSVVTSSHVSIPTNTCSSVASEKKTDSISAEDIKVIEDLVNKYGSAQLIKYLNR